MRRTSLGRDRGARGRHHRDEVIPGDIGPFRPGEEAVERLPDACLIIRAASAPAQEGRSVPAPSRASLAFPATQQPRSRDRSPAASSAARPPGDAGRIRRRRSSPRPSRPGEEVLDRLAGLAGPGHAREAVDGDVAGRFAAARQVGLDRVEHDFAGAAVLVVAGADALAESDDLRARLPREARGPARSGRDGWRGGRARSPAGPGRRSRRPGRSGSPRRRRSSGPRRAGRAPWSSRRAGGAAPVRPRRRRG